ncbi:MAG: RecX family transcriptional regulator [Firmicutes bacterium]|nr:RecX family transcriptional regulator [Bacillota bacterium]
MVTITALTVQKNNKNRANLFLDGEFFCGLDLTAAVGAGLKVGVEINEERLKEVVYESEYASALGRALKYLEIKACSERRIREYLVEKGHGGDVVEAAVARLLELGYLDDMAVATEYVKANGGKYGNGLLRLKLRERGIRSEVIAAVLPNGEDEAETARSVTENYLGSHPLDRQKLYNYLLSKGFSGETIAVALKMIREID